MYLFRGLLLGETIPDHSNIELDQQAWCVAVTTTTRNLVVLATIYIYIHSFMRGVKISGLHEEARRHR